MRGFDSSRGGALRVLPHVLVWRSIHTPWSSGARIGQLNRMLGLGSCDIGGTDQRALIDAPGGRDADQIHSGVDI
jgi:hypothetical protein